MPQRSKSNNSAIQVRIFIAAFGLLLFSFLLVPFSTAERLPVKTYTTADGLQRDSVSRIRQDSRGFLWFCTGEGLSRFDGVSMTNFTTSDGLPYRYVNDFLETKNGTIYIATGKGLARLNPQGLRGSTENPLFTAFLPDNPKADKIQILYEDRENQVWVGTSDGLYKLIETGGTVAFEAVQLGKPLPGFGGAIAKPDPDTININSILEDRHGTFWVGTFGSGLFRLSEDGKVRRYTAATGLGDNKITDLVEDHDGRLWVSKRSDSTGGLCQLDTEDTEQPIRKCYTAKDGLGSNWIRDMFEASDGQMWLATVAGLCRWQDAGEASVCKTYSEKNNLCGDAFTIAEDRDGNLWSGSSCGAKKIARYGFTTYDREDGLDENPVNAIFENSKGELFATSFPKNERVVSRFDGDKFSTVKVPLPAYVDYHGWGWQQTVWQDRLGAWWIPTGYGLFRSPDNTSFEDLARAPLEKLETGAQILEPFRLFEDSRGDIWMATTGQTNELKRWERAKNIWHDHTSEAGISANRGGTAFGEDSHGNVWIGTSSDYNESALIRYRNGEFRVFSQAEGAPAGWTLDLFLDSRGRLWIATTEDGLLRLDDTNSDRLEFYKYTPANGLTSIATTCVTEDEFGRIYVGTWRGVDRLNPDTGQIENFSNADGLPSGYVESSYRDRKNKLWFMTEKGLARFVPEPLRQRKSPNILITGLRVNGEAQNVSILGETELAPLDLRSDQRQITVDFLGLGTSLGEKLKYEYRFGDADWTATNERTLNFANLAAGDYRFEVRAQTADRIYSQTPAGVSFKIAAPLWQRWWFLLLMALLVGIIIYSIYRYRLQQLLELEKVRTRIATDLHDDIGSNLSKISLLSGIINLQLNQGKLQNRQMLDSIAEISRESVNSMSDIVWTINPNRDSVLEMTRRMREHAEEIFVEKGVKVKFDGPPAVDENLKLAMDMRREIYLIFKEAVNNAMRHSDCTRIDIDFRIEGGEIILQINDNGRGFDVSQITDGNGLENMKARAKKIGGRFEIKTENGARISVRIPHSHYR